MSSILCNMFLKKFSHLVSVITISILTTRFIFKNENNYNGCVFVMSQYVYCDTKYECSNQTLSGSYIFGLGYKSIYGLGTSITAASEVYCAGAYSCSRMAAITSSNLLFLGDNSGSHSSGLFDNGLTMACFGIASCAYSQLTSDDVLGCYGDQSCAYSNISNTPFIGGYGAYSLRNGFIHSKDVLDDIMTVELSGYHAGLNLTIFCDESPIEPIMTCQIYCYNNGCFMTQITCVETAYCIVYTCDEDDITTGCVFVATELDTPEEIRNLGLTVENYQMLYDILEHSNDYEMECNNNKNNYTNSVVFDTVADSVSSVTITQNNGHICCRGYESCYQFSNIETFGSDSTNVICSGHRSCAGSTIINNNNKNGVIYCTGFESCSQVLIYTSYSSFDHDDSNVTVYCSSGRSCDESVIANVSNLYVSSGSYALYNATVLSVSNVYILAGELNVAANASIISNDVNMTMNVTLYTLLAGYNLDIHCNYSDTCYIRCLSSRACENTSVYCYNQDTSNSNCIFICDELNDIKCPIYALPSQMPTISPTNIPSLNPSSNPTNLPTAPTSIPTQLPTITWIGDIDQDNVVNISVCFHVYNISYSFEMIENYSTNALEYASVVIRSDILYNYQVYIDMIDLTQSSNDNYNNGNDSLNASYIMWFEDESMVSGWLNDISNIRDAFETRLQIVANDANISVQCMVGVSNAKVKSVIESTVMPSLSPTVSYKAISFEEATLSELTSSYSYVLMSLVSFFVLVILGGYIHATFYQKNELFNWISIALVGMYCLDFYSDLCFILQVWQDKQNKWNTFSIVIISLSLTFFIIPTIANFIQMQSEMKRWLQHTHTKQIVRPWIRAYVRVLYITSILTGSTYSSIELCNSNLFSLKYFSMELPSRDKQLFKHKRIYSIVLSENVPQIIIQLTFCIYYQNATLITAFSMVFSLISVILALLEFTLNKYLFDFDNLFVISFKVESPMIQSMSYRNFSSTIGQRRKLIALEINYLFKSNDESMVELLKPIMCSEGAKLIFHLTTNMGVEKQIKDKLHEAISNQTLQSAIQRIYQLKTLPQIIDVETAHITVDTVEFTVRSPSVMSLSYDPKLTV